MASFESQFRTAALHSERGALLTHLRNYPQLTVAEIAALAKRPGLKALSTLTVAELLGQASPDTRKAPKSRSEVGSQAEIDTRTPAGRARYDARVLEVMSEEPATSQMLRPKTGGTVMQFRAAVNRLIQAGKVTWDGQAKGTRYWLA